MQAHAALIVIDVQNDFCTGGALAVPAGETIVPLVNRLMQNFSTVVVTQDWHPAAHISFAANHRGRQPYEMIELDYGSQVLWPVHCVRNSPGAELHPGLALSPASLVIRKGMNRAVDSYSAFLEADRKTRTGLDGYLRSRNVTDLYLCGLATDFCVAWSAEDAAWFGFHTAIIEDACRAINLNGSLEAALGRLDAAGVARITSATVK